MVFSDEMIQAVWEKGRALQDLDPTKWRQDQCGAWIHRDHYDNVNSEFGWKIRNVVPGGGNELEDLQPFHWNNTFDLENGQPQCRVTADRSGVVSGQRVNQPRNISV